MTEIRYTLPDPESVPTHLLWADCEFTGLDANKGHKIIEIGGLVTDLALREVDNYQSFVSYDWAEVKRLMALNPWWDGRDQDKARMEQGVPSGKPPAIVDTELAAMRDEYFGNICTPLYGNSVGNDKRQIEEQFPTFAAGLHYRIVDVSSLKILAWNYQQLSYTGKQKKHYALDDIRESVDELRFLLTELGITDLSRLALKFS